MLRNRLAALFIPVFISISISGAAFAGAPIQDQPEATENQATENQAPEKQATEKQAAEKQAPQKEADLSAPFSVLHAVSQWSTRLSGMADRRAKSELVKGYARAIATANATMDGRLQSLAQKHGIAIAPLDPQTEDGKSVLDRIKAETALLGSLEGDAWDKEYMTLVTNTQQSVIRLLESMKASAIDPEVKQFLDELTTTVQSRLTTSQDIMAKIYGDEV